MASTQAGRLPLDRLVALHGEELRDFPAWHDLYEENGKVKAKSEYNLDLYSSVQRARFFGDFTLTFCFFGCQYGIP